MKFGLILTICLSYLIISPPSDTWEILSKLKFKLHFDEKLDDVIFTPQPTKAIKEMVGKNIEIEGFKSKLSMAEDLKSRDNSIFLCRYESENVKCSNPYGTEAYIEILPNKTLNLIEGKLYLFKGVFELNIKNNEKLPFILKEAECINCNN